MAPDRRDSSTSIARCCAVRAGRSSARRSSDAGVICRPDDPRRGARCTGSSTCSARPGRAMELTRAGGARREGLDRQTAQEAGEQRRRGCSSTACSRSPTPLIDEHQRRGAPGGARHHDAVRPGEAARRRARLRRCRRHPLRRGDDGTYDGTIDGEFVWGKGKLARGADVGRRARRRPGEQLRLLRQLLRRAAAVRGRASGRGEPRPAPAAAAPRRGAGRSLHLDVPDRRAEGPRHRAAAGARWRSPGPSWSRTPRFDIEGVENIPKTGPAIIVGNHRSYFDPMAMGHARSRKRGRPVRFLGKKEVFDVAGRRPAGQGDRRHPRRPGHRVRRAAAGRGRALEAGELVAMMPQGTIPRGQAFFDPVLKGRWGAARLAAMTQRAGDPGRPVGHRAGVAAQRAAARTC